MRQINRPDFENILYGLTRRQMQALKLFLGGKTDLQIAQELNVGDRTTISQHISNVARQFGFANRKGENFSFRDRLVQLFIRFKPDWVCEDLQEKYQEVDRSALPPKLERPGSPLSITDATYIRRNQQEPYLYEVLQPGALIRIRAAKRMGKTSLLNRIHAQIRDQEYSSILINLQRDLDLPTAGDLGLLLQWFCGHVCNQLSIDLFTVLPTTKVDCTSFWQEQILKPLDLPLVLILDNADWLFDYPEVTKDFFSLLRGWHEMAKDPSRMTIWGKLRVVIAHATDNYIKFDNSPFENVGVVIQLERLHPQQIQELITHYPITYLKEEETQQLTQLVNGHPYLLQEALYHLASQQTDFAKLMKTAPTMQGIYGSHLKEIANKLQSQPALKEALQQVINGNIRLDPEPTMKLEGLGLIQLSGNQAQLSCQLYRLFFQDWFSKP